MVLASKSKQGEKTTLGPAKLPSAPTGRSFTVILRTTRSLITSHLFPFAHGYVSTVPILPTSLSDAAVSSRHRELNTLRFGSRQFWKFRWLQVNHFDLGQGPLAPWWFKSASVLQKLWFLLIAMSLCPSLCDSLHRPSYCSSNNSGILVVTSPT